MGVPLIAGRDFTNQDRAGAAPVAVVNESFARLNWPGENALGKQLQRQGEDGWSEVVGIVGDVRYGPIDEPAPPTMYFAHAQVYERTMTVIVRTTAEPLSLASVVRQEVRAVDPAVLLLNLRPMQTLVAESLAERRLVMTLLASFAALALFLAVFGIYSVVSYTVTQRTPEIGIRIAMGARAPAVLSMILKQGATLALTGVALGMACAVALSNAMSSLVYGVATTDPIAIAVSCTVLTLAALAASYFPARRAARLDPLTALRHG
jgi:predicted permease